MWRALRHPNVLPLLGVTITEDRLVMVSEWMVKGNITEFVKVDVNADRLGLVRFGSRPILAVTDDDITIARRRYSGVDVHARPWDCPRGSQRGTSLNPTVTALAHLTLP